MAIINGFQSKILACYIELMHIAPKLKGTMPRDSRLQVFFHESVSPKPLSIPLGKVAGVHDTGGNLPPVSLTSARIYNLYPVPVEKFAAGVVNTGGKFVTCVV
jgi:hypothetical protein